MKCVEEERRWPEQTGVFGGLVEGDGADNVLHERFSLLVRRRTLRMCTVDVEQIGQVQSCV